MGESLRCRSKLFNPTFCFVTRVTLLTLGDCREAIWIPGKPGIHPERQEAKIGNWACDGIIGFRVSGQRSHLCKDATITKSIRSLHEVAYRSPNSIRSQYYVTIVYMKSTMNQLSQYEVNWSNMKSIKPTRSQSEVKSKPIRSQHGSKPNSPNSLWSQYDVIAKSTTFKFEVCEVSVQSMRETLRSHKQANTKSHLYQRSHCEVNVSQSDKNTKPMGNGNAANTAR